jgi:hypothetical protein
MEEDATGFPEFSTAYDFGAGPSVGHHPREAKRVGAAAGLLRNHPLGARMTPPILLDCLCKVVHCVPLSWCCRNLLVVRANLTYTHYSNTRQ